MVDFYYCKFFFFQIYLGEEHWLLYNTYKIIVFDSDTPSQFIRSMALAVFGLDYLLRATVTGRPSNRNKKKTKPDFQLDINKVCAIKCQFTGFRKLLHWNVTNFYINGRYIFAVIFRYYLTNVIKLPKGDIDRNVNKTGTLIGNKISDLKRSEYFFIFVM